MTTVTYFALLRHTIIVHTCLSWVSNVKKRVKISYCTILGRIGGAQTVIITMSYHFLFFFSWPGRTNSALPYLEP